MATNLQMITSAFRKSGILAAGISVGDRQKTVGMERLAAMFRKFLGDGLFGSLDDVYVTTATYTAKEFERIYLSVACVVTFPATLTDPDSGEVRNPKDGAVAVVVDPATGIPDSRMYDRMIGQWQSLDIAPTALSSVCPMSYRYEEGLTAILAVMLLEESNMPVNKTLATQAAMARQSIATRYDAPRSPIVNTYF